MKIEFSLKFTVYRKTIILLLSFFSKITVRLLKQGLQMDAHRHTEVSVWPLNTASGAHNKANKKQDGTLSCKSFLQ